MTSSHRLPPTRPSTPPSLPPGFTELCGRDRHACERARTHLVALGAPAVPSLTELLADPNPHTRLVAAQVLCRIGSPTAAPRLVSALEDRDSGVCWAAAQALIASGRGGLVPLLQTLIERSNSVWLREGAHHVLRGLVRRSPDDPVAPVLAALEDIQPVLEVPPAAQCALNALH